jgi:hypothetical protein
VLLLLLTSCGADREAQQFDLECYGASAGHSYADRYSFDLVRRLVATNGKDVRPIKTLTDAEISFASPTPFTKEDVFLWTVDRETLDWKLEFIPSDPDDPDTSGHCERRPYTSF